METYRSSLDGYLRPFMDVFKNVYINLNYGPAPKNILHLAKLNLFLNVYKQICKKWHTHQFPGHSGRPGFHSRFRSEYRAAGSAS